MIVDEIIDKANEWKAEAENRWPKPVSKRIKLDLKYIYDEAVLFEMKDIVWAIAFYWKVKDIECEHMKAHYNIVHALKNYMDENGYNEDYKKYISVLV